MPRTRSTISPAKVPKVAEASRLSSSQNQKQDASATLSPAPKGRKTAAQGDALGNRPTMNPSPEGAAPMVDACETGDQLLRSLLVFREQSHQGRGKYPPPIEPIIDGLPKPPGGWTWASADQLTSFVTDGEHQTPERSESGILLLSARNIHNGFLKLENVDYVPEHEYERISKRLAIQEGDVLLSCSGSVGRTCVAPASPKFTLVRSVAVLRPLTDMGKFMSYALQSPFLQAQILEKQSQTAQANIFQGKIKTLVFPFPPLPEQRRIVARIEELFSHLDAGVAALRHAKAQLQRYRQSVLAAAVTGSLPGLQPIPPEAWRPISDVIKTLDQGWSPKCESTFAESEDEWAVIKTTAIQPGSFLDYENKKLPSKLEPRGHLELKIGDLLLTRAGPRSRVGVACYVRKVRPKLMLCDKAYRVRLEPKKATPGFIELVLNSPRFVDALDEMKSGISDSGLNLTQKRFAELLIPLPPIAEQIQIVAEVEARTTAIDHLEAELDRQIVRASRLRQSILTKAFAGELTRPAATIKSHVSAYAELLGAIGNEESDEEFIKALEELT